MQGKKKGTYKSCPSSLKIFGVRFGQTAVMQGFITIEQLKDALLVQVEDDLANRPHRLLGDICQGEKWMTSSEVETVLTELINEEKKLNTT